MAIAALLPWLGMGAKYLMGGAILAGASSMWKWSTDNLEQTGIISADTAKRLELQWAEFRQQDRYLDMREDELEWEQLRFNQSILENKVNTQYGMAQTMLINSMDKEQLEVGSYIDIQRIQSGVDMAQLEMQQEAEERHIYLRNLAFQTTNNILARYGNEVDPYKLSYMIQELRKLDEGTQAPIPYADVNREASSDPQDNFDYARGDDLPPDAW